MWPLAVVALEASYQTVAVVDALQTAGISQNRYEREIDFAIGHHPKPASVAEWFGGMALGHFAVTDGLLHWGKPWMPLAWESVTIGFEGETVAWNIHVGARF